MNLSSESQSSVLKRVHDFVATNRSRFAGTLLFTMGIVTAKALNPGYSTS